MEVAVVTGLPAEWNMNVDACHYLKGLLFDFRQVNPPAEWNMYINPGQIKYF